MDMYKDRIIKTLINDGLTEKQAIMQYNNLDDSEKKELIERWWKELA